MSPEQYFALLNIIKVKSLISRNWMYSSQIVTTRRWSVGKFWKCKSWKQVLSLNCLFVETNFWFFGFVMYVVCGLVVVLMNCKKKDEKKMNTHSSEVTEKITFIRGLNHVAWGFSPSLKVDLENEKYFCLSLFWLRLTGAQERQMSVCLFDESLSRAFNLHLCFLS